MTPDELLAIEARAKKAWREPWSTDAHNLIAALRESQAEVCRLREGIEGVIAELISMSGVCEDRITTESLPGAIRLGGKLNAFEQSAKLLQALLQQKGPDA